MDERSRCVQLNPERNRADWYADRVLKIRPSRGIYSYLSTRIYDACELLAYFWTVATMKTRSSRWACGS